MQGVSKHCLLLIQKVKIWHLRHFRRVCRHSVQHSFFRVFHSYQNSIYPPFGSNFCLLCNRVSLYNSGGPLSSTNCGNDGSFIYYLQIQNLLITCAEALEFSQNVASSKPWERRVNGYMQFPPPCHSPFWSMRRTERVSFAVAMTISVWLVPTEKSKLSRT